MRTVFGAISFNSLTIGRLLAWPVLTLALSITDSSVAWCSCRQAHRMGEAVAGRVVLEGGTAAKRAQLTVWMSPEGASPHESNAGTSWTTEAQTTADRSGRFSIQDLSPGNKVLSVFLQASSGVTYATSVSFNYNGVDAVQLGEVRFPSTLLSVKIGLIDGPSGKHLRAEDVVGNAGVVDLSIKRPPFVDNLLKVPLGKELRFLGLPEGSYSLAITQNPRHDPRSGWVWAREMLPITEVKVPGQTSTLLLRVFPSSQVTFRMTIPADNEPATAWVRIDGTLGGSGYDWDVADELHRGVVEYSSPAPLGPHTILFRAEPPLGSSVGCYYSCLKSLDVTTTPITVDVSLQRAVRISGRVVDDKTGDPVSLARIPVYLQGTSWRIPLYFINTDDVGEFVLDGIPPECSLRALGSALPIDVGTEPMAGVLVRVEEPRRR